MTDEEYVRSKWRNCATKRDEHNRWLMFTNNAMYRAVFADSLEKLWAAAAEFTRERLEQIRQLEEEIAWLSDGIDVTGDDEPIGERILAREQAALADLKRGMK